MTYSYDRQAGSGAYDQWLTKQKSITPDQRADHRNYLSQVMPLVKTLEQFLRQHAKPFDIPTSKFSKREAKILEQALKILESTQFPVALLPPTVDPDDALKGLLGKR